jgi:hypothetical protein
MWELITDGLPNGAGSGTYVWMADFARYDLMQITRWTGVEADFDNYHDLYTTWSDVNTQTRNYRCAWFPIDTSYAGPTKCNAGQFDCFKTEYAATADANAVKAKTWADPIDRPPASWITAVKDCADEGGSLASVRDMTELIRAGLANGQGPNNYVHTSDAVYTDSASYSMVLRWNAINTSFVLQHSNQITHTARTTSHNYRCVWSNELK